jgi:cell division protein FtsB
MKAGLARFAYAAAFLLAAIYAVAALTGPNGIAALREKQREIRAVEARTASLRKDNARAAERIQRLGADQSEQERVVEERLKLVHPGEKVYVLPDSPKK